MYFTPFSKAQTHGFWKMIRVWKSYITSALKLGVRNSGYSDNTWIILKRGNRIKVHSVFPNLFIHFCLTEVIYSLVHNFCLFKGHLISKCLYGVFKFFKKTNKNKSTWGVIVVKLKNFIRFLEELRTPKSPFEINWPLALTANIFFYTLHFFLVR